MENGAEFHNTEANKRILIVDDDAEATEIVARYLTKLGFLYESVFCGAEAMEKMKSGAFDAVISDVRMPFGSGIDLLREMHAEQVRIPIILMSADEEGVKAQAKALGADAFVSKPLRIESLRDVMTQLHLTS